MYCKLLDEMYKKRAPVNCLRKFISFVGEKLFADVKIDWTILFRFNCFVFCLFSAG